MQNYIISKKESFKQNFMPDKMISRQKNIEKLNHSIKLELLPVLHVFGRPGTGKTLVIKTILKNHHPYKSVYVNCWEHGTYHQIFDEIVKILKERADEGLRDDSFDMKLLSTISKICDGNARCAIQILGIAAAKADELQKDKISIDEVRFAAKCTVQHCRSFLLNKLNSHQKLLYEILKHDKCVPSGNLYREYQKGMRDTVTDRCYRKYMKGLVKLDLAREISSGRWKRFEII